MFKKDVDYNSDLEKAILGICLLEKEAFGRLYGLSIKEHFYFKVHQQVFEVLADMYSKNIPIDILTVADYFNRVLKVEHLDNNNNVPYFLTVLCHQVTGSTHLEYWCYILQTLWMEREIITLTNSGAEMLKGDTRAKLFELQEKLSHLSQKETVEDFKDMSQLMVELYQHQDEMKKTKGKGLVSGINQVDEKSGGFQPGQLVLVAARPGVGKSAFAGQMAYAMAKDGNSVGFITLEMNNNEVAARLAAIDTETDFSIIYRGLDIDKLQAEHLLNRISNQTTKLPIYVSDKTGVDIISIKARVQKLNNQVKRRQIAAKQQPIGLKAVFIDYLQLIEGNNTKNRNREQEVSAISRGCKLLAKEMNITVIAMAQLSRSVAQRTGDKRFPELYDLRESGSLEQDADVVFFLHKDWLAGHLKNENGGSTENEAHLVNRKWRNQESNFIIPLNWNGPQMKFTERGGFQKVASTYQIPLPEIEDF